ncbi:MAG: NAD(+) synthase [Ignavibacteria bacterium]|nr:NAD(+) synthase [Ignavibacteria bacterium]
METINSRVNLSELGYVRVSAVTPELRIGNVQYNIGKIVEALKELSEKNVQIVVFPELCLTGYTCGDLFYQTKLLDDVVAGLKFLVDKSLDFNLLFIVGLPLIKESRLFNCAAIIGNGKIYGIVRKSYIPNTREFYEKRWFTDFPDNTMIRLFGEEYPFGNDILFVDPQNENLTFGIEICQDLWAVEPVSSRLALSGAKVIFNLSASDEWIGKSNYRRNLVLSQSARVNVGYVYAGTGAWESSTDMVFSGHCIIAENGKLLAERREFSFETTYTIADIDLELLTKERVYNDTFSNSLFEPLRKVSINIPKLETNYFFRTLSRYPFIPEDIETRERVCEEVFNIQSTGLARRLLHTNSKNVVLGLSGGLDSTLALLVSVRAFQKLNYNVEGILSVLMPGFGTTQRTFRNAKKLANFLGVSVKIVDIRKSVSLHLQEINASENENSLVFENAQARERTQILMDLANKINGFVVGTGDLSEIALGWSTYNADHMSMYNVNAGVPKTLIRYIIHWVAENLYDKQVRKVLQDILSLPSSPELISNKSDKITQITEEIVGPFDLNDFFLFYSVRFGFAPSKILFLATLAFKEQYTREEIRKWLNKYYQRFFVNQFKRSCMPDGPKVGSVDLSPRGSWRMPSDADFQNWNL